MHESFPSRLAQRLQSLRAHHLARELLPISHALGPSLRSVAGPFLHFASNDYLGLAQHPLVRHAAETALRHFGAGSAASRLICGSLQPHHDLEAALASLKGTPAALTFTSGFATALGAIPALVGPHDSVVLDRLAHACLVDGARLSGAKLRVFRHNDPEDLRRVLKSERARRSRASRPSPGLAGTPPATLVITESVFSMDGDVAPLRELVEVKDEFGAWLLVDEAHATGVLGPTRAGWIEALGLKDRVEITLGTLGKALGAAGGYIAGSADLRNVLIHDARSFLFSTAPPPAQSAAALAAIGILRSDEGRLRHQRLWERVQHMHAALRQIGWDLLPPASPILPLRTGDEARTLALASALRARGFLVPAIRFPTVARGQARLRITVTADHTPDQIESLVSALADLAPHASA
jgi:8-amino-7-oxononanoate synthase